MKFFYRFWHLNPYFLLDIYGAVVSLSPVLPNFIRCVSHSKQREENYIGIQKAVVFTQLFCSISVFSLLVIIIIEKLHSKWSKNVEWNLCIIRRWSVQWYVFDEHYSSDRQQRSVFGMIHSNIHWILLSGYFKNIRFYILVRSFMNRIYVPLFAMNMLPLSLIKYCICWKKIWLAAKAKIQKWLHSQVTLIAWLFHRMAY